MWEFVRTLLIMAGVTICVFMLSYILSNNIVF